MKLEAIMGTATSLTKLLDRTLQKTPDVVSQVFRYLIVYARLGNEVEWNPI